MYILVTRRVVFNFKGRMKMPKRICNGAFELDSADWLMDACFMSIAEVNCNDFPLMILNWISFNCDLKIVIPI